MNQQINDFNGDDGFFHRVSVVDFMYEVTNHQL